MGVIGLRATAAYVGIRDVASLSEAGLGAELDAAGLTFPLVAKPTLGLCGYGVRKLDDMHALVDYARHFPAGQTLVLQEYLSEENEAGIFYAPDPRSGTARLIGLALRYYPRVTGDGRSPLGLLMRQNERTMRMLGSSAHACPHDLDSIPAAGQVVRLATIGSTRVAAYIAMARP